MADEKVVKVKYEIDLKAFDKAIKAEKEYQKRLVETGQRIARLAAESKRLDQERQRASQVTFNLAEALRESSGALNEEAQAAGQATEQIRDHTNQIREQARTIGEEEEVKKRATAATKALAEQRRKETAAVKKSTRGWLKNAKTLAFWAIGAASVFRLVQKIRRAFFDTVKTLFENTEEYKRLQVAQDNLKVAFVAAIGSAEDWDKILGAVADSLDAVSEGVIQASATVHGFNAAISAEEDTKTFLQSSKEVTKALLASLGPSTTFAESLAAQRFNAADAKRFLDAYNASLEESARLQEQFANQVHKPNKALAAMIRFLRETQKAAEKLDNAQDALANAQKKRLEELADLERERLRRLEDITLEAQRAFADIDLKGTRKREDIELAFRRRLEDIQDNIREQLLRNEERLRLKLLRIELRFREKMIRIRENFDDSIFDAISKRDATAALLAIRRRRRDEGRARRERDNAILLANAEAQTARNQAQRNQERQREDALKARARALEDLRIDLERERQDVLTNQQRQLDDLQTFLKQREDDITIAFIRQFTQAAFRYTQLQTQYQAHLDAQFRALQRHLSRVERITGGIPVTPLNPQGTIVPGVGLAKGGDMIFKRPTTIQVAEGGRPERVIAQPITPGVGGTFSGTMRHQITGSIDAAMQGFEGRMGAIISEQAIAVMRGMLQ